MKNTKNVSTRLKAYFDPYVRTRLSDWHAIGNDLVLEKIKNKTVIKHPGEKEKFLRFILDGAAALLVKQGSREICFDLCFEDEFLADFESLNANQATEVYIRTFEPVLAAVVDSSGLSRICKVTTLGPSLGRIITEQQHSRSLKVHIASLGKTVEDRYRKLLHDRPDILLRTPQHYLASYLGVSPQNLSRIRRKISESGQP